MLVTEKFYLWLWLAYYTYMPSKKLSLAIVCLVSLLVLLLGFSPYNMPLFFVILPMVPMTILAVLATSALLNFFKVPTSISKKLTIVSGITMGVALVLLSLGQFTAKDFTILFLFGLVGAFYVSRMFGK